MCKIHVHFSQEILSLTENNRFRSSQPRKAPERYHQFYEKKTRKTLIIICLFVFSNLVFGKNIPLKQSENKNNEISVVIKKDEKDSDFDKYFIDLLGPIIAIAGLLITIPILKKKLLENHISKALIDIQDSNKKLLLKTTELIDDFSPKLFTNDRVLEVELKEIFEKIKEIYKISQEGNSDSQTFLFFLKYTLQNTIKHYDPSKNSIFTTREIYGLVLNT